jgi:hypothetical protein
MSAAKRKTTKAANVKRGKKVLARPKLDPLRTGMPAIDSIIGVDEYQRGKTTFRVIHTNELDEYEQRAPKLKRKKR